MWGLVDWWLRERCPEASAAHERGRLEKHLKGADIAGMPVALIESAHFDAFFADLLRSNALAGASVNHVRAKLRTAFERARREGKFTGVNPLLDTKKLKAPRRAYETLTLEEVPLALAMVAQQWRSFVAAAVYMALRKGELAGSYKSDVDLSTRTFRVRRSWERQTTKGGEPAELPIPEPLVPYLEVALKTPGPFLFPNSCGGMLSRASDPHLRLKTALARAGLVVGFELCCRKCMRELRQSERLVERRPGSKPCCEKHGRPLFAEGVRHLGRGKPHAYRLACRSCRKELRTTVIGALPAEAPTCPKHRLPLAVKVIPRAVRLHDMRHSTATILLRAGVPLHHVQRIMRHADPNTTASTYAHLVTPDLRAAMKPLEQARESGTNPAQPPPNPTPPTGAAMQNDSTIPARFERATPGFGGPDVHRSESRADVRAVANGGVLRTSEEGELSVPRAQVGPGRSVLAQNRHSAPPRAVFEASRGTAAERRLERIKAGYDAAIAAEDRVEAADRSTATTVVRLRRPFRGGMLIDDDPDPHPASSTAGVRRG